MPFLVLVAVTLHGVNMLRERCNVCPMQVGVQLVHCPLQLLHVRQGGPRDGNRHSIHCVYATCIYTKRITHPCMHACSVARPVQDSTGSYLSVDVQCPLLSAIPLQTPPCQHSREQGGVSSAQGKPCMTSLFSSGPALNRILSMKS